MFEEEEKDDEIEFDFGKIKNFFKRKKKEVISEVKEEAKEVKEEIKEMIDEEKEKIKEEQDEIKKEEKKIDELKKEEKQVEKIEKEIKKDPEKAEEKIEEIKEEVEKEEDDEINIDFSKIKKWFKSKEKDKKKADEKKHKEEVDDEELNIDFSKIKGWFKKLTKEEKTEEKTTEEKEDDEEISLDAKKSKISGISENSDEEFSIDFKKVKNFFKGFKEEKAATDEEEISFDFRAISNFFIKHKALFLILIPLIISIYLRMMPAYLPVTDEWAKNSVYNGVKSQIKSQINEQYPNLPDANKAPLVDAEFKKVLEQQKPMIEEQIKGTSEYFKSRLKNDKGQTYLLAIDPYFWMRKAENIIEHGYPGDEIKNGVQWNNHMVAPTGRPSDVSLHPHFEAYLFKFLHFFNRDIELMTVAFYIPIIISALSIIPAFFIARRLGGNFGGFIAAFIVAIHPSFLTRTAGGFADTDAYNVMFPLYIAWFFLEAFETNDIKKRITFASLAGLIVGLFAFAWQGWWYIFDFILASAVIYVIYYILREIMHSKKDFLGLIKDSDIKNTATLVLVFIISSAVFVSLFTNFSNFIDAPTQPLNFIKIKQVATDSVWPNVFTTVAEQNQASLQHIINSNGSKFLFFLGLIGILFTLTQKKIKKVWFVIFSAAWYLIVLFLTENLLAFLILISIPIIIRLGIAIKDNEKQIDVKYAILLIIWFVATIYASTKGVRFTLLLVPAFGVAFGVCLGVIYRNTTKLISKGIHINENIAKIIIIFTLCLLIVGPYKSANATVKNEIPSMNDAWWNSLEKIKIESEPNAIINSWWDFGHWFKMIADRQVTFDGTSQGTPQAHWIGNVLLTNDEDTAIGILRMLDCSGHEGGTYAFDEIDKTIKDTAKSVDILYEMVVLDKERARKVLEEYELPNIDEILKYTHCKPPENYFITSEDMIGKSGVWSHFGSWDFDKALMYYTINKGEYRNNKEKSTGFLKERFNITDNEAENIYYEIKSLSTNREVNDWIAPWPGYASGLSGCSKKDSEVECGNGIKVNLNDYNAEFSTPDGIKHPNSIVYATKQGIKKRKFENDTMGVSAALIPSGEGFQSILMSPELADSMFTRLFFIEGHGLKHFKKFSDERSVFGGRVIVWKVDWEGTQANIMDEFKEKPLNETTEEVETEIAEDFEGETPVKNISNETEITEGGLEEEIVNEEIISEGGIETEEDEKTEANETETNKANITIE